MAGLRPLTPTSLEPPTRLKKLKTLALKDSAISRTGLTTTAEGHWALKLWLRQGVSLSKEALEKLAEGYPVVTEDEPPYPAVARPDFPAHDE